VSRMSVELESQYSFGGMILDVSYHHMLLRLAHRFGGRFASITLSEHVITRYQAVVPVNAAVPEVAERRTISGELAP
jgi:hypothetical protein